jgi:hypothetical protein
MTDSLNDYGFLTFFCDCIEIIWNQKFRGYINNDSTWILFTVYNTQEVQFSK